MRQSDVILGFDPGVRATGWGVIVMKPGSRVEHIASGTIQPAVNLTISEKLLFLETNASEVVSEYQPSQAAIEKAFIGASVPSAFLLGHARAACLISAARAGVPIMEYAATTIKKALTGFGRADKSQIGFMVGQVLPSAAPDSEHAADALAIALCHGWRRSPQWGAA